MLTVLKLKAGKTYNIPSTGITLKAGEPTESPANPILVIAAFTSALNRSTLGLSFDIHFEIYASPYSFFNGYSKVFSSFVAVPDSTAYQAAMLQVPAGTINLIDKVQQLLVQILLSQPGFVDWELGTIPLP